MLAAHNKEARPFLDIRPGLNQLGCFRRVVLRTRGRTECRALSTTNLNPGLSDPGFLTRFNSASLATRSSPTAPLLIATDDGRWRFNGQTRLLPPGHPTWSFPLTYAGSDNPVLGPGKPDVLFVNDMSDLIFRQPPWVLDKVVGTLCASHHIGLLLILAAEDVDRCSAQ
jgi:hypothetical protein